MTVALLVASALVYARGVRALWARAGRGQGITCWQAAAFGAGLVSLALALLSPLAWLAEVLFSAHMTQHEILMLVSAPLFCFARPLIAALWAMPHAWRERSGRLTRRRDVSGAWRALTSPLLVFLIHALALWVWHIPALFEAALRDTGVHAVQHLSFLLTAALFWWGMMHGRYGRIGYGVAVLYVFLTAVHSSVLGALLTVAPGVWYPWYTASAVTWQVHALEDQQLAGLLMWVPSGVIFIVVGLALFAAWLGESERRAALGTVHTASPGARGGGSLIVLCAAVVLIATSACRRSYNAEASHLTGGDPRRGVAAIGRYGCGSCHDIPGVKGARGTVGPPLARIASRTYLAGRVTNTPADMIRWIRHPQKIEPGTAMPEMGVTDGDARDIAAYLYTLR